MLKLQMTGNLGQNAKIQQVNDKKSINFAVAHNRSYENAEGVKVDETIWINCSYWKEAGQSVKIAEFLTQGTKVFIEGVPSVKGYKDKDGNYKTSLNCNVNFIEFQGVKPEKHNDEHQEQPEPAETAKAPF